MNATGAFFVRYRVRLGYPLALAVLFFARPTLRSILYGALIGVVGLAIRAGAAGYLHKQEILTVSGPYAYTRNPLYFGSAILALGTAVASRSWISAIILAVYFAAFYSIVMKKEENELRPRHGEKFERYAAAVPLFFPRPIPARLGGGGEESFSSAQYKKNHEWQAALGYVLMLLVLAAIWHFHTF
jgi:protein-S-isoprenylcysteine O-methyltransferase Ste14